MVVHSLLSVLVVFVNLLGSCTIMGKMSPLSRQFPLQSVFYTSYPDTKICRTVPGLTKAQIELCHQQPDTFIVALEGLNQAINECQHQFQGHRWNCSSLSTKSQNPYISIILQKGYKETAFAYAIASAGVAVAVARSCSTGALINCGCDSKIYKYRKRRNVNPRTAWKWGGCSHNLQYGIRFSKIFLDSRERAEDIHSKINLHNNQVGRMAVSNNMQVKCKCHGMSGSCELKTCWRAAPDFRIIGKTLKDRFRQAVMIDQANLGDKSLRKLNVINQKKRRKQSRLKQWTFRKNKNKRDLSYDLLYYQKSPNFCEKDQSLDLPGTIGRFCNRTSTTRADSCSTLCCGRGYNLIKQKREERCNCKFKWCCIVECDTCNIEEWISVCK